MIAYFIQVHEEFEAFRWVIRRLHDPRNHYIVSVDADVPMVGAVRQAVEGLANVHVIRSVPVVWGGATVVSSILRGIDLALTFGPWEHFINLSGRDIPFYGQNHILARLGAERTLGRRNFIRYFGESWIEWQEPPVPGPAPADAGKPPQFLNVDGDAETMRRIGDPQRSPILHWYLRPNYFANENLLTKRLGCRPLNRRELKARQDIFTTRLKYRAGRQWFVFSRGLCEWIARCDKTIELFDLLRHTLIPDEAFFHSLLEFAPPKEREAIYPRNLRFRGGDPGELADDVLPDVGRSEALFGRKLGRKGTDALRAFIARRVQET